MNLACVTLCHRGGESMATPTKTIRLRPRLRTEIERIARHTRRSFSEVAQALLEEAVRTRECPGIYFADEPAGRSAKVAGTGLGVWEVIRDYKTVKGSAKKLRRWLPHLSTAQLKAATVYYARFPQEIEAEIADDIAAHAEGRAMQQASARRA
jgi:uncharacterized protein (DUF433 family)